MRSRENQNTLQHCSTHKETDPRWELDLSVGEMSASVGTETGAVMVRRGVLIDAT